ncbi:hypothetical protein [Pseudoruegeria sp. HB172150]|uniref:hypothetical protein n=1 Tax=Pseudoruegeria sp. HB172150 TaxID=2721164 RepID=UPI0015564FF7|nr:hypothetical protein [Pseudoruegeria sp. HB172150]
MIRILKSVPVLAAVLLLAACDPKADLEEPPADLGPFKLGHNIVVARDPTVGPLSRTATEEEWKAVFEAAVDDRFGRYDGNRLYHLGISVDGYVLAMPGVPVVASPKSVLIFTVTAWDDALGRKLNEEAEQLTVLESLSGDTFVGSGLTLSKEEQMANLSASAAKAIEKWLLRHPEWFEPPFE